MDTEMKMKCPHCGMDITLDELFKTQMGKKMEGERAKIAEEILKGRDEETNQKIASAVKEATEEQGKKITELLEQIKRLTDANQKATEKMQEMAQTQFELQQKLQNVQLDEQTKFNEKSDELVQKTRKETEELIGGKLALAEQKIKELSKSLEPKFCACK